MKYGECSRYLKYDFTHEELEDIQKKLAHATLQLREKEEHKKAVMSQFTSDINSLKADTNLLAEKINSGFEFRDVTCDIEYDFNNNMKTIIRQDTGEIVETVQASSEEIQAVKQRSLNFEEVA